MRGQLGLPRSARLRSGDDFSRVFAARRKTGNRLFTIHYRACSEGPRLGMAVSRKVSKRAVARNRIRRQIRESFRLGRARLDALDFVVVARSAAAEADRSELRRALNQLWHRLSADR